MARSRSQTRPATTAEAHEYLAKAREYLFAARESLGVGNFTAATGNAVHAGINGGDAMTACTGAAVWRGEHGQAADFLEKAGSEGRQAARHLRRLVPLKNRAEYEPAPVRAAEARSAVSSAERLIAIAERVVEATSRASGS